MDMADFRFKNLPLELQEHILTFGVRAKKPLQASDFLTYIAGAKNDNIPSLAIFSQEARQIAFRALVRTNIIEINGLAHHVPALQRYIDSHKLNFDFLAEIREVRILPWEKQGVISGWSSCVDFALRCVNMHTLIITTRGIDLNTYFHWWRDFFLAKLAGHSKLQVVRIVLDVDEDDPCEAAAYVGFALVAVKGIKRDIVIEVENVKEQHDEKLNDKRMAWGGGSSAKSEKVAA